jgi:HK97 family phage major capsid protein
MHAALDGSGSGANPQGIANATGIETFATASGRTMTHAESLNAIAEVAENNYDTSNGVWLVHPTNAATLGAQAKDSGSGQFVYQDGMIAGRRVIETTHAAAGTCYFGLFENVMIGTFGGVDIVVDPYTNGSTGVVNIYAYQLCDAGVLRPNAFQKVTLTP